VREDPLRPRPELVEARFGAGDEHPELDLGGFSLHGKIDRVDVDEAGSAGVVRDYKLSGTVTSAAKLESEGKLQLQLYMLALRELWSIEPLGAVYEPLGGRGGQRPRGPVRERERDGALQGTNLSGTDFLADDELEAVIARARERGGEVVAAMRAGRIARNPLHGRCPQFCEYQAICRRERGAAAIEEREGEEGSG
jgi:ATP-dependent helicase/DNAse subunit B